MRKIVFILLVLLSGLSIFNGQNISISLPIADNFEQSITHVNSESASDYNTSYVSYSDSNPVPFVHSLYDTNTFNNNIANVFILTGQSNAVGRAPNSDATTLEKAEKTNFKIWSKINSQFENLVIGTNNLDNGLGEHGIELGLANNFNTYYPNQTGYLIKWAKSSTEIVKHLTGGEVYTELWNNYVKPAVNTLVSEGKEVRIHLIYSQGERDANSNLSSPGGEYTLYSGRFDTLISLWQTNFSTSLPIVSYQLLDDLPTGYENDYINDIFDAKALTETNYTPIQTRALDDIGDNIHYAYSAHKSASILVYNYFATHQGHLQTSLIP